jgi:hypothetical protein
MEWRPPRSSVPRAATGPVPADGVLAAPRQGRRRRKGPAAPGIGPLPRWAIHYRVPADAGDLRAACLGIGDLGGDVVEPGALVAAWVTAVMMRMVVVPAGLGDEHRLAVAPPGLEENLAQRRSRRVVRSRSWPFQPRKPHSKPARTRDEKGCAPWPGPRGGGVGTGGVARCSGKSKLNCIMFGHRAGFP